MQTWCFKAFGVACATIVGASATSVMAATVTVTTVGAPTSPSFEQFGFDTSDSNSEIGQTFTVDASTGNYLQSFALELDAKSNPGSLSLYGYIYSYNGSTVSNPISLGSKTVAGNSSPTTIEYSALNQFLADGTYLFGLEAYAGTGTVAFKRTDPSAYSAGAFAYSDSYNGNPGYQTLSSTDTLFTATFTSQSTANPIGNVDPAVVPVPLAAFAGVGLLGAMAAKRRLRRA